MKPLAEGPVVAVASRVIAPIIQIVGLYVLAHGHDSPGGGFQGGVLLAASFILQRLAYGKDDAARLFPTRLAGVLAAAGVLAYTAVGFAAAAAGGRFLDYAALPLGEGAQARSNGILLVEAGVAVAVSAALVSIYDDLAEGARE